MNGQDINSQLLMDKLTFWTKETKELELWVTLIVRWQTILNKTLTLGLKKRYYSSSQLSKYNTGPLYLNMSYLKKNEF